MPEENIIPTSEESSAPQEQEKPQAVGVEVPAGPQVPGVDMTTGERVGVDSEKPEPKIEEEVIPEDEPPVGSGSPDTEASIDVSQDPIIPV